MTQKRNRIEKRGKKLKHLKLKKKTRQKVKG